MARGGALTFQAQLDFLQEQTERHKAAGDMEAVAVFLGLAASVKMAKDHQFSCSHIPGRLRSWSSKLKNVPFRDTKVNDVIREMQEVMDNG